MELGKKSLKELKEMAKELGIRNVSTLRKPELVDLLTRAKKMTEHNQVEKPAGEKENTAEKSVKKPAEKP